MVSVPIGKRACADVEPQAIINAGLINSICFSRNGLQISISSGVGLRFAGGRQNIEFVIYTLFARVKPIL